MEDNATLGSDMSTISDLREAVLKRCCLFYCLRGNQSDKPRGTGQSPDIIMQLYNLDSSMLLFRCQGAFAGLTVQSGRDNHRF